MTSHFLMGKNIFFNLYGKKLFTDTVSANKNNVKDTVKKG